MDMFRYKEDLYFVWNNSPLSEKHLAFVRIFAWLLSFIPHFASNKADKVDCVRVATSNIAAAEDVYVDGVHKLSKGVCELKARSCNWPICVHTVKAAQALKFKLLCRANGERRALQVPMK